MNDSGVLFISQLLGLGDHWFFLLLFSSCYYIPHINRQNNKITYFLFLESKFQLNSWLVLKYNPSLTIPHQISWSSLPGDTNHSQGNPRDRNLFEFNLSLIWLTVYLLMLRYMKQSLLIIQETEEYCTSSFLGTIWRLKTFLKNSRLYYVNMRVLYSGLTCFINSMSSPDH